MIPSIRGRLTASLVVALAVVIAAAGILLHVRLESDLLEELDEELALEAREMFEVLEHEPAWPGDHAADGLLAGFQRIEEPFYYEVWAPDGTVVLRSTKLRGGDLQKPPAAADPRTGYDLLLPGERAGRAFAMPIAAADWEPFAIKHPEFLSSIERPTVGALVIAATDVRDIQRLLRELRLSLGLVIVVATLVTTAVVGFTVRRALRPLDRLTARAATVGPDDLAVRFSQDGSPRELRPIHRCLDELLQRIAHAFERERRFNSDVAHELRTPVAELKTMCEVALRWSASPNDLEGTVRQAGDIANQMDSLINVLLRLRRAEAGEEDLKEEEVDLVALVRRAFEQLAPRIQERRLTVDLVLPDAASLRTDRTLIAAIIGNLVSNAVDHAPESGSIRCIVVSGATGVRLEIENAAPGLSAEDLPQLFEPFWRKDPARSGDLHAGLGLTLARTFAERLGMRLTATMDDGRTLRVSVDASAVSVPSI